MRNLLGRDNRTQHQTRAPQLQCPQIPQTPKFCYLVIERLMSAVFAAHHAHSSFVVFLQGSILANSKRRTLIGPLRAAIQNNAFDGSQCSAYHNYAQNAKVDSRAFVWRSLQACWVRRSRALSCEFPHRRFGQQRRADDGRKQLILHRTVARDKS